jgi:general secretion pathway protein E
MIRELAEKLHSLDPRSRNYAVHFVEQLIPACIRMGVSDIHVQPTSSHVNFCCRIDGVLQTIGNFPREVDAEVVARLKVLANLQTYRNETAQEGRMTLAIDGQTESIRVCTMPTMYGERATLRLLTRQDSRQTIDELSLPADVLPCIRQDIAETSGVILLAGPAGSGKTTTAYALLREIVQTSKGGRNVITLEDPIENAIDGIVQCQTSSTIWTLDEALKASLRHDPEVLFVSEIRQPQTAELVFQAALSGQLVISTMHASSAVDCLRRLVDMGIQPYQLRSGLRTIVMQRLLRRLCECACPGDPDELVGIVPPEEIGHYANVLQASSCSKCAVTSQSENGAGVRSGYQGRILITERLPSLDGKLAQAVLENQDTRALSQAAAAEGMISLRSRALQLIQKGTTSVQEVIRVLGPREVLP